MLKDQDMPRSRAGKQEVMGAKATPENPQQDIQDGYENIKAAPRRVLVVDDNQDASKSLATVLSELGYLIQTAQNGKVALELALDFLPHVVLLDIVMPDMSGFALAERLRSRAELRDTLLITLTGWAEDTDAWLSKQAGCDYHLLKPIDLPVLETYLVRGRRRNYGSNLVD